jgi:CheY-like chemotaxis protein
MTDPRPTVLIVDDDAGIRRSLERLLAWEGYATAQAANGVEALAYLRDRPRPRVVLLDLMMPEMNGWEFMRAIATDPLLADVPIVLLSAHTNTQETADDMRVFGWLDKPIDLDRLIQTVEQACA